MIKDSLANLMSKGAACAEGTDRRSVELASTSLTGSHLAAVPAEYAMLLEMANGIVCNGYEFFGTKKFAYDGDFRIPALLDANLDVNDGGAISGKLLVGRGPAELLLYDEKLGAYQSVERYTLIPFKEHANLSALLEDAGAV